MRYRVFVQLSPDNGEVALIGVCEALEEARLTSDADPMAHIEAQDGIVSEIID